MPSSHKKPFDYAAKKLQLDKAISSLQNGEVSIDEALKMYQEATQLVAELENYLKSAENSLKEMAL